MPTCICSKHLPRKAKQCLSRYAVLVEFSTSGITYEAISAHPDIFFCKVKETLIMAPNVPEEYKIKLRSRKIEFAEGANSVRNSYPGSTVYNAVVSTGFLIHSGNITDPSLANACSGLEKISVRQGYTRCSLLPLKEDSFITSDEGIHKKLTERNLNVIYVKPEGIMLPGFSHGFFGGTCGVYENTVFIAGSLAQYKEGDFVKEFLRALKYEIVELYDGPLFDCGSLLFV